MADQYKTGDKIIFVMSAGRKKINGLIIRGPTIMPDGRRIWYVQPKDSKGAISINENQIVSKLDVEDIAVSDFAEKLKAEALRAKAQSLKIQVEDIVSIEYLESRKQKVYLLTGVQAHDPRGGVLNIARSPLGMALVGRAIGEEIPVPGDRVRILHIDRKPGVISPAGVTQKPTIVANVDLGEKAAMIRRPANSSSYVNAGPGTGKSFSLVHRASYLMEKCNLSPKEILVLSFSREAVAEVKRRLASLGIRNIEYISPVTIDSFAAIVVRTKFPEYRFGNENYDEAIVRATSGLSAELTESIKHIFIDEIQDVVGCRAEFVQKLLTIKPQDCGVTILGDLRQAIYNWTLSEQSSELTANLLIEHLKTIIDGFEIFDFTVNFRTNSPQILSLEREMRELIDKAEGLELDRRTVEASLASIINKIDFRKSEQNRSCLSSFIGDAHRKAVLFRDNGQLISEKEKAIQMGLPVQVLGKYSRGLLPSWVAAFLIRFARQGHALRGADFVGDFCQKTDLGKWNENEAWEFLKTVEGDKSQPNLITVDLFKRRLKYVRDVPICSGEKREMDGARLTFSTYHQSKGLEFEHVFLVDPAINRASTVAELCEELKVIYVGITRAIGAVMRIPSSEVRSMRLCKTELGGSTIERWWRRSGKTIEVNVDNEGDVDGSSFIRNTSGFVSDKIQYYLSAVVNPGSDVEIVLERDPTEGFSRYFIKHNSFTLGCMSRKFYKSVEDVGKQSGLYMPKKFTAKVGKVYSEYNFDAYAADGLDENYTNVYEAWLALKLTGLATTK